MQGHILPCVVQGRQEVRSYIHAFLVLARMVFDNIFDNRAEGGRYFAHQVLRYAFGIKEAVQILVGTF